MEPVSYTHLDVYKRQEKHKVLFWGEIYEYNINYYGSWNRLQIWRRNQAVSPNGTKWRDHHLSLIHI